MLSPVDIYQYVTENVFVQIWIVFCSLIWKGSLLSIFITVTKIVHTCECVSSCVSVNKHLFSFDLTSLRLDFCVVLSHKHSFSITYRTMDVSLQQDWSPGLNCVIISWDGVWPELPCHFVTGFSCKSPTLKHRHSRRACVYKPFINSKLCL